MNLLKESHNNAAARFFPIHLSVILCLNSQCSSAQVFIVQQNVYGKYELQIINENLWKNARKKCLQTDDWLIQMT